CGRPICRRLSSSTDPTPSPSAVPRPTSISVCAGLEGWLPLATLAPILDARGPVRQSLAMYRMMGADGAVYGPVSADQLRAWISEGRANAETQILVEGAVEWRPLRLVPEFSSCFGPGAPRTSLPPSPIAPLKSRVETNAFAVGGLTLGILSCTVGLCCCY